MRMNVCKFFLGITFLISFSGLAQNIQLSGYLKDYKSGEALHGASIVLKSVTSGKSFGSSSNTFGFYSLAVHPDTYLLSISFIGYTSKNDTLYLSESLEKNYLLNPAVTLLDEVLIGGKINTFQTNFSGLTISKKAIELTPQFMGEADLLKVIQLLPGVSQGREGEAGLHVRGGSPDQNLLLLDGIPVYNIYHLFGFISIFNPNAIRDVSLYRSGVSGRYEGRLSSVVDINLKEGDKYNHNQTIALSPIAGTAMMEGPLAKGKNSYLVTVRRTWLDAFLNLARLGQEEQIGYNFYDASAKLNFQLPKNRRMYFSYYGSRDKFYSRLNNPGAESEFSFRWGNQTAQIRHTNSVNKHFFWNSSLFYSKYTFAQSDKYNDPDKGQERFIESYIRDIAIKSSISFNGFSNHEILSGVELNFRLFNPEILQINSGNNSNGSNFISNKNKMTLYNFFIEDVFTSKNWKILLSIRNTLFDSESSISNYFQWHTKTSFNLNSDVTVFAGYDNTTQFLHLLTNTSLGQPTDLWVAATPEIPPQSGEQFFLGSNYGLFQNEVSLAAELFYKRMNSLVEYKEGANYIYGIDESWEENVTTGTGEAYGLEILLQKPSGKITGWISYTLSRSSRQFEDLNNGKPYPYKYDRRHDGSAVMFYHFNERNSLSASFTYRSGYAQTLPVSTLESNTPPFWEDLIYEPYVESIKTQPLYSDRNNFRMPAYHRLDVSYKNTKVVNDNFTRIWTVAIYNIYNRLNPYFIYQQDAELRQFAFFPFFPSVALELRFR